MTALPILEVTDLTKHFPVPHGLFGRQEHVVRAVDQVSLMLEYGQTLAVVANPDVARPPWRECC